jgi:Protein of unknown function (DUF4244)
MLVTMPVTEKVAAPAGRVPRVGPGSGSTSRTPESGSQTTEYALVMVVAATIAALALAWARQGAINGLLNAVLKQVRGMLGIG